MSDTLHQMVWRRARPGRAALLLPPLGPQWAQVVKRAVVSLSLTWGGLADILVPTGPDYLPHPLFRRALAAFDPDYIAAYCATGQETAMSRPDAFDQWRAARADSETASATDLIARFASFLEGLSASWWDASDVVDTARSWCSPYRSDHGHFAVARKGRPIDRPLIPLSSFPGLLRHPIDLDLSCLDSEAFELMLRIRLGGLSDAALPDGSSVQLLTAEEGDVPALAELACMKTVTHRPGGHSQIRHLREMHSELVPTTEGMDPLSPRGRTQHGMQWVQFEPRRTWVVVVGDTCEDFCFALACDRMLASATWLPLELMGDARLILPLRMLRTELRIWPQYGDRVLATSASLTTDQVREATNAAFPNSGGEEWLEVIEASHLDFGRPRRLGDPGSLALGESSICYLDDRGTLTIAPALEPPIPEVARTASPSEVAWEVDTNVDGFLAPAREAIGPSALLSRPADRDRIAVRVGCLGVTFHSHKVSGITIVGWSLEQHLVRPSVRVPGASDVLAQLAESSGHTVRPSQTGRLNQLMINMWDGLLAVADDLSGPVWAVLDEFVDRTRLTDGPRLHSIVVNGLPYMTSLNAQELLGHTEVTTRAELDRLLRLSVLRRGLLLRCERCHWLDFYPLDDVGQRFVCRRCVYSNVLVLERWRHPVIEPAWFYDLDHGVREALRQNGDVVLLALAALHAGSTSFTFTTDFELVMPEVPGPPPELDFAAVRDGVVILGEAKSNGRLGAGHADTRAKLGRIARAAATLGVNQACFATTRSSWSEGSRTAIFEALASDVVTPLLLEGLGRAEPT